MTASVCRPKGEAAKSATVINMIHNFMDLDADCLHVLRRFALPYAYLNTTNYVRRAAKYRCRKCRRLLTGTQGAVLEKGQTPWRHLISTNLTLFNPIFQHPSITLLQFYHSL